MAKSMNETFPARLSDRYRRFQLASDRRTGAHSRREVRDLQSAWVRKNWWPILVLATIAAIMSAIAYLLLWESVRQFAVGAIVTSAAWWLYLLMLDASGIVAKRNGIEGELSTASELRKLQREGWMVVNHVMVKGSDVDHIALGPGGFVALETKYRTDWASCIQYLDSMRHQATRSAWDAQGRIGAKRKAVRAVLVMWGPKVLESFPTIREVDGVAICPGPMLREYLLSLPSTTPADEVTRAFDELNSYVMNRDAREIVTHGELPRDVSQITLDLGAVGMAAMLSALLILAPISVGPDGVWAVATASAIVVVGWLARRRWANSVRAQRLTTAVITVGLGLGVLLLLATVNTHVLT